jgi:DNA-binding NarL/FixJ family response regulator
MEFFVVFLLGAMLAVVALVLLRPGMLVKPTPDFSLLEEMAEELMGRIEEREAELDQKYQAILEAINQGEQRLLRLSEDVVKAFKNGDLASPKVKAVLELKEQGLDDLAIAKQLGVGVGEVQLILALNDI